MFRVSQCNLHLSLTPSDGCRYIRAKSGGGGVLMTAFPPKPLTDESATLEQAGLLNSALIVKP